MHLPLGFILLHAYYDYDIHDNLIHFRNLSNNKAEINILFGYTSVFI